MIKLLNRLKQVGVFFLAFILVQLIVGYVLLDQFALQDEFLVLGLINLVLIFVFIYLGKHYRMTFFNSETVTFKNVLWGFVVFFGMNILVRPLLEALPVESLSNQVALEESMISASPAYIILATVVLGPLCEELLFRGVLIQNVFKDKPWIGLVLSSSIFALMHNGVTLTSFIIYGVMGCNLGLVYMKTKSIECVTIVHAFNNLLASLVALGILVV